jgi:hypothetical protein
MENPDIVIVGGGIAGGAFASVMARAGFSVLMLEITKEHRDVVRGEAMTPCGVAEAQKIGTYDVLMQSGGHHPGRFTVYDEDVDPAEAEANALDFDALPFPPLLCMGHPTMCNALDAAAVAAGAKFLRGVRHTQVTPGAPPKVSFEHEGSVHELRPRLVVGSPTAATAIHGARSASPSRPIRCITGWRACWWRTPMTGPPGTPSWAWKAGATTSASRKEMAGSASTFASRRRTGPG